MIALSFPFLRSRVPPSCMMVPTAVSSASPHCADNATGAGRRNRIRARTEFTSLPSQDAISAPPLVPAWATTGLWALTIALCARLACLSFSATLLPLLSRHGHRRDGPVPFSVEPPAHPVFLRYQGLQPGDLLASVAGHAAHGGPQRAFGHVLETVDRPAVADALDQGDVLLLVRIVVAGAGEGTASLVAGKRVVGLAWRVAR